jgi:hypothetical protein
MVKRRWIMIIVGAALAGAILACSFSFSTAKMKNVRLASDKDGKNSTTVFAPADVIYCVVDLANAPQDTKVKAVWKAAEVEGYAADTKIDETELKSGSATLTFSLAPESTWPVGKYKVELYLNGEKKETLDYTVQQADGAS